jgi:hypothetical protein
VLEWEKLGDEWELVGYADEKMVDWINEDSQQVLCSFMGFQNGNCEPSVLISWDM